MSQNAEGTCEIDEMQKLAFLATKITCIMINQTNKNIGGAKMRAADLSNFKKEDWQNFYRKHFEVYKLICSEILETDFVVVSKQRGKISGELLNAFKRITLEKTEKEEAAKAEETSDQNVEDDWEKVDGSEGQEADTEEAEEPNDLESEKQSDEDDALSRDFSEILNSLKKTEQVGEVKPMESLNDYIEQYGKELTDACLSLTNHKIEVLEEPTRREAVLEEESLEPDPEFLRQLEEQRLAHQKELLEAKQRRAEKNKEFEEELKEIREKQKQCTVVLLNCIILKQRFEEKKQEVADWIENCYKKPIVYLFKHFSNFETVAHDSKYFKIVSEDSTQEVLYLHKNVLILLDTLRNSFDQLQKLAEMKNDATFLKVLQRSICDRVKVLNQILDVLEENEFGLEWYTRLTTCFGNLNIAMIPTTEALQRLCSGAVSNEDFEFPVREVKNSVIINEMDDSSDTSERAQEEPDQKPKRKRNCESIIDKVQTDKSVKQSDPHLTVAFLLYHYREQFSDIFCK